MKRSALALAVILTSSSVFADGWFSSSSDVDVYRQSAKEQRYDEARSAPDICKVLSEEACGLLSKIPAFVIHDPEIDDNDKQILAELLSLTPQTITDSQGVAVPEGRLAVLRTSAMTLGVQVGIAVESARYNKLWKEYKGLYDRSIDFEALLIENPSGRNIVPPVVQVMGDSRQVASGGRVFRFADVVYRITSQPRFAIAPPNWRDYLTLEVVRPEMPLPGLMPSTKEEADFWKTNLVRGYLQGIETTRFRVRSKYRSLVSDYIGMVNYLLLRDFNMISSPTVEITHNPVLANHDGSMMAIDDSIAVLTVEPLFNSARRSWEVFPQLQRMKTIQKEYMDMLGVGE